MSKILRVDSSMRRDGSLSRTLTDELVEKLGGEITVRDLLDGVSLIDENWVQANFTPADQRSADQMRVLAESDKLVSELIAADTIVIGAPIYNFSVPGALKAWIDQIARAGLTFKYTETGPLGLLENKKAYIVVTSGGTEVGSDIDYASQYLRHVIGFVGITDVTFITADQLMMDAETKLASARKQIAKAA